jgi:hypothetical protein
MNNLNSVTELKKIATLVSERKQPGHHQVEFIPDNLSSGIYFYKIKAGDFQQVMKMVFVR